MYTGIIVIILLVVIWLGCAPKSAPFTPGSLNQMRLNAGHAIKKALGVEKYESPLWIGNTAGIKRDGFESPQWIGNTAGLKREGFEAPLWAGNSGHIAGRENYNTKLSHEVQQGAGNAGWPPAPYVPSGLSVGAQAGVGQGTLYAGIM